MLIACPRCKTRYLVEDDILSLQRKLLCASCDHVWLPNQLHDEIPDKMPPLLSRENAHFSPVQKKNTRSHKLMTLISCVLSAFILLCLPFVFTDRSPDARFHELHSKLLPAFNAAFDLQALKIENIDWQHDPSDENNALIITGQITNQSSIWVRLPDLEFDVLDANKKSLRSWILPITSGALAPLESKKFQTQLASPPEEAIEFHVNFVSPQR